MWQHQKLLHTERLPEKCFLINPLYFKGKYTWQPHTFPPLLAHLPKPF
ncbi:MAG: hypothetical protein Q4B82_09440 [Alysiella sp.]|nr:hypothetical protein [Alysiella sp.]MDO4434779.1 hypothetical protein [Alysiella sp.]